jgi:hypothetical protein
VQRRIGSAGTYSGLTVAVSFSIDPTNDLAGLLVGFAIRVGQT